MKPFRYQRVLLDYEEEFKTKTLGTVTDSGCVSASALARAADKIVHLEERGLLARHCRGDQSAFPALLNAYRKPIYSYLVRFGIRESDRDDLFQTIFLKIHKAANSYQASRPLAPWIFTIVANTVRNHFRDGQQVAAEATPEEMHDLQDPKAGPEHLAQIRESLRWVEQAIAQLPSSQREVLLLSTVVGLPQNEVADSLNLPLNTVKTHLRRARLTLAQGLAQCGLMLSGDSNDNL